MATLRYAAQEAANIAKAAEATKQAVALDAYRASQGFQPLDADTTAIAALTPNNDDLLQRKAGAWTNRTPAQVKTDLVLVKADVGLGNVDNTSDANKPVSTATQTALDGKMATWVAAPASAAASGTAGQLAYDASYLYVCTASNTWRRIAHATW